MGRHRRGVRQLDERPGRHLPAAARLSPPTGARRSISRPWYSAIWAIRRRPASPSPATRPPARTLYGEYLVNAQGEDVVAGIRTPQSIADRRRKREINGGDLPSMEESMPELFGELDRVRIKSSKPTTSDMQDMEFTVQEGKLWMLQTRSGKRTAKAALKIAVDMADVGLISEDEAVRRIDPGLARPASPPDARPDGDPECARRADCRRRRAPPAARSSFPPTEAEALAAQPATRSSWCRIETSPRTSTACMPPRAFSPPAAA